MSRQYPLPNDLITADLIQQVTDGHPKRYLRETDRAEDYHHPVTDLADPNPGRPPKKGELSVLIATLQDRLDPTLALPAEILQVFNGTSWKGLKTPASVLPAYMTIDDVALVATSFPATATFKVKLYNPGRSKIIVHYVTEDYNPIPLPLRGTVFATEPTLEPGYTGQVGSLVYDPNDESNDDFVVATEGHLEATVSVPVTSGANGRRFQVRLFDPLNVRLDRDVGICILQDAARGVFRVEDVRVITSVAEGGKPDEPATIDATSVRFPVNVIVDNQEEHAVGQFTWETINGTAVAGEDFTAIPQGTSGLIPSLNVAIPAQLVEQDEYFLIKITPTNSVIDWTRRTAVCWIEGNPANPLIILPEEMRIRTDGLDRYLEVPYYVYPASATDLTFDYWLSARSPNLVRGLDFPDIVHTNPTPVIVPAGQSYGTIRIPFNWIQREFETGHQNIIQARIAFRFGQSVFLRNSDLLSTDQTLIRVTLDRTQPVLQLPRLTPGNSIRSEEAGFLDFPLTLDRPPPSGTSVIVDWTTIGLSASPDDYDIPASVSVVSPVTYHRRPNGEIYGQAVFTASGDDDGTSRTIRLAVTRDTLLEEDERLRIRFTNPVRCRLVRNEATGTIRNDDLPTAATGIPDFTLRDGQVVGSTMTFEARLSRPASSAVTFDASTTNGTATAGSDYLPVTDRRVVIGAGRQSAFVRVGLVPPVGDTQAETLTLTASNLSGNANPVRLTARGIIPPV